MDTKSAGIAALLALFVCEHGIATCEFAARRFEAPSRTHDWHLDGRAVARDAVTDAD
jgi:hypothetical protein